MLSNSLVQKNQNKKFLAFLMVFSATFLLLPSLLRDHLSLWVIPLALLFLKPDIQLLSLALFALAPFFLCKIASLFNLSYNFPFLHLLLPIICLLPFLKFNLKFKNTFLNIGSWKLEKPSPQLFWQMASITILSLTYLIFWRFTHHPVLTVPKTSFFIFFLPLLALINAGLEEVAFRGLIQGALTKLTSSFWIANILQAIWFGAMHYQAGFPSGASGFFLSAIYGAALGQIRISTGSLSWCIIMHFFADLTIANLLIFT